MLVNLVKPIEWDKKCSPVDFAKKGTPIENR